MLHAVKGRARGFTLVELAIVLAIAGLLFVGLWRLMAGGNQQLRDQAVANQQEQLITAVKAYLAADPQGFLRNINGTAGLGVNLPLPPTNGSRAGQAACKTNATMVPVRDLCDYLPPGFWVGNGGVTNAYGQTFAVRVLKDGTSGGQPPRTYSFMILTSGGDLIPDTSGGRISALIGADGGFVYSTNVCGTAFNIKQMACGAYGGWSRDITSYGFTATANSGVVASNTYVSATAASSDPWLARQVFPVGDTTYKYNTMTTDLYMGQTPASPSAATNIYMARPTATSGGGNFFAVGGGIYMANNTTVGTGGGNINLQGGTIVGNGSNNSRIQITAGTPAFLTTSGYNPLLQLGTGCTRFSPAPGGVTLNTNCQFAVQVTGDVNMLGTLQATNFYASGFVYQTSDARLKINIAPIANPLENIMRLKPVSYAFKSSGAKSLGVLAQDIEKIYPQLVAEQNGVKAVNYEGLIAPLIGAVQELKRENDQLREDLLAQEARQKEFEREMRNP
ncbi:MAG: tail fiber domain-containing protein [Alphaproteobacteria bacterium]|nr:tail fiber domain-containing protein [Alphaproteobacteria bacterium]